MKIDNRIYWILYQILWVFFILIGRILESIISTIIGFILLVIEIVYRLLKNITAHKEDVKNPHLIFRIIWKYSPTFSRDRKMISQDIPLLYLENIGDQPACHVHAKIVWDEKTENIKIESERINPGTRHRLRIDNVLQKMSEKQAFDIFIKYRDNPDAFFERYFLKMSARKGPEANWAGGVPHVVFSIVTVLTGKKEWMFGKYQWNEEDIRKERSTNYFVQEEE